MKHINLTSFKGSITDWTELNYVQGGLADEYADIANLRLNDTIYNYLDFDNQKIFQIVDKHIFSSSDNIRLSNTAIVTDGTNSYIRGYLSGLSTNMLNNNISMVELPTQPPSYWYNSQAGDFISIDRYNGNILITVNTNKAGNTLDSLKAWLYGKSFIYELSGSIDIDITEEPNIELNRIALSLSKRAIKALEEDTPIDIEVKK